MSSASAGSWMVAENLALQRRILVERQARLKALGEQSQELCRQVRGAKERYGPSFPELIGDEPVWNLTVNTVAEVDERIQQIQIFNERLTKNLAQTLALRELKQMILDLGGQGNRREGPRAAAAAMSAPNRVEREALVDSLLKGAGESLAQPPILACARMAIETEYKARFETLMTELRHRIQQHDDAARARGEEIRLVGRLRDRLAGLEGENIKTLLQELRRVEDGEIALRPSLENEVEAARVAARSRVDRQYAAAVFREELTRLGYIVEEGGFESLFVSGGKLVLQKPDLREYNVVMSVNPKTGSFGAYVARTGAPGEKLSEERRHRDHEMEEHWCADLASLLSESRRKGIHTNITEQLAPGQQAVVVKVAPAQAVQVKPRYFQRGSD